MGKIQAMFTLTSRLHKIRLSSEIFALLEKCTVLVPNCAEWKFVRHKRHNRRFNNTDSLPDTEKRMKNFSYPRVPLNLSYPRVPLNFSNPRVPLNFSYPRVPLNINNPRVPLNFSYPRVPLNINNPGVPLNFSYPGVPRRPLQKNANMPRY